MSLNIPFSPTLATPYEKQVSVLVADSHPTIHNTTKRIRDQYPWFRISFAPESQKEILQFLRKNPDTHIVIMNLGRGFGSTDICIRIQELFPDIKVLFSLASGELNTVNRGVRAGGMGAFQREMASGELLEAIRTIARGKAFYGKGVTDHLIQSLKSESPQSQKSEKDELTRREIEVLREVGHGFKAQQIADYLHISKHTVETHRRNLLNKLGIQNSLGLVRYAILRGYSD